MSESIPALTFPFYGIRIDAEARVLDASDLRFLKLTPVSASAFTVLPAR